MGETGRGADAPCTGDSRRGPFLGLNGRFSEDASTRPISNDGGRGGGGRGGGGRDGGPLVLILAGLAVALEAAISPRSNFPSPDLGQSAPLGQCTKRRSRSYGGGGGL